MSLWWIFPDSGTYSTTLPYLFWSEEADVVNKPGFSRQDLWTYRSSQNHSKCHARDWSRIINKAFGKTKRRRRNLLSLTIYSFFFLKAWIVSSLHLPGVWQNSGFWQLHSVGSSFISVLFVTSILALWGPGTVFLGWLCCDGGVEWRVVPYYSFGSSPAGWSCHCYDIFVLLFITALLQCHVASAAASSKISWFDDMPVSLSLIIFW